MGARINRLRSVASWGSSPVQATARGANYVYNPDRNPNLLDLPAKLPVVLNCEWDKQTELRNGDIESDYRTAFQAYIESTPSASKQDKA
eukprot:1222709-Prymnesium_polylepis.1